MEIDISTGFVAEKAVVGSGGRISGSNKFQRTESLPYKMVTMNHNLSFPFAGGSLNKNGAENGHVGTVAGGGGSSGVGPTSHNESYKEGEGGWGSVTTTLQSFESPGIMAPSLRFPFTSAQWQELERQALIYKYMVASAPVPPNLLMPTFRNLSDTAAAIPHSALAGSSCFNLRFSSGMDPEPGRCRRTDGKKWRCARDAAPDQKYCEKHLHRGRPRSRKPVELHLRADIKNIEGNNKRPAPLTPPETVSNLTTCNTTTSHQLSGLLSRSDFKASPFDNLVPLPSYKEPRGMDWMMSGEEVPLSASNQHWRQLTQSKTNSPAFRHPYEGELSLETYSSFGGVEGSEARHRNDQCFLFLNPEITSLGDPSGPEPRQTPRSFIDAWSSDSSPSRNSTRNSGEKLSICADGKLPPSALALSMSGGNFSNENSDQIQMGLGVNASWTPSPPGGPLAEVLRPSTAGSKSNGCCGSGKRSSCCCEGLNFNLMSSGWGTSGDTTGSPIATTASSPSEVLQQSLVSVSDSSGSSSPTFKVGAAKSEFALQWLNQGK